MVKEEHRMKSMALSHEEGDRVSALYRVKCYDCGKDFLINDEAVMYPAQFIAYMEVNAHREETGHNCLKGRVEPA